jgi:hypothetical protein
VRVAGLQEWLIDTLDEDRRRVLVTQRFRLVAAVAEVNHLRLHGKGKKVRIRERERRRENEGKGKRERIREREREM